MNTRSERTYREEYINLLSVEPKIADLISTHTPADLSLNLDKGRREFRNAQVHSISNKISIWVKGVPENKHLRGFENDVCGRLLCPSTRDWEDPMIREQIQSFQIPVTADDFPKFLWKDEEVDPNDMNKSFLRSELLVKVLLCILIGPAAARPGGQSSGVGGYADLLNLQTLSVPALAFGATLARFALSTESKCIWSFSDKTPGFNNLVFYQRIISTVGTWKDGEQRSLLVWWNRAILSHVHGGPHATQLNNAPAPGSAAALMMQQAAGAAIGPN